MLDKVRRQRLRAFVAQLERAEATDHFLTTCVTEAWPTRCAAFGLTVSAVEPLELAVRFDKAVVDLARNATKLRDRLAGTPQLPMRVSFGLKPGQAPTSSGRRTRAARL